MWYLWLQILFLLILAALCGAGIAYWWLRGRYEDVTESYTQLNAKSENTPDLMLRSDLDLRLTELADKIEKLENTDLGPLEAQLLSLSDEVSNRQSETSPLLGELNAVAAEIRQSDRHSESIDERLSTIEMMVQKPSGEQEQFDAMYEKIHVLETSLVPQLQDILQDVRAKIEQSDSVNLAPLTAQLTDLQDQIEPLNSMPPQLATLSKQATSLAETQDSSLKSEIALLEQRLTALTDVMWQPMQKDLQSLSAKIPATSDVTRQVEDRLRAIEEQMARTQQALRPIGERLEEIAPATSSNATNHRALGAMDQKLVGFEDSIVGIKQRMDQIGAILSTMNQRVDPANLESKLDQYALEISALRKGLPGEANFAPIEQSITRLQQMIFNLRERDLSTLETTMRSMESRVDFAGVENRLTSIEYGLAATHHMLRSRLEQNTAIPQPPKREPFTPTSSVRPFDPPMPDAPPLNALDPVDIVSTQDDKNNLLVEPGFGPADNLEKIRGVGPMLRQLLNDTGVFYYWQIAEWTKADVDAVDALLPGYQGRITRDRWVEQAKELATLSNSAQRPQPFGK
ncbi:MAG: hypothetical protein AAF437_03110 [Pseudomonadota bacterium]